MKTDLFTKPVVGKLSPTRRKPAIPASSSIDVQRAFRECQARRQKVGKPIISK